MTNKLKVGDKLWLVNEGLNARYNPKETQSVTIETVGHKYFTVKIGCRLVQFFLKVKSNNTFEQKETSHSWVLYTCKEVHDVKQETALLITKLNAAFDWSSRKTFTLPQLRDAAQALGLEENENEN